MSSDHKWYVQGNNPNEWMLSHEWQSDFLSEIARSSANTAAGAGSETKFCHQITKNGRIFSYAGRAVTDLKNLLSENSRQSINETGVHKQLPYYTPSTGWFSSLWTVGAKADKGLPPVCELVNIKTGTTRLCIFTDTKFDDLDDKFPFTSTSIADPKCLKDLRTLMSRSDLPTAPTTASAPLPTSSSAPLPTSSSAPLPTSSTAPAAPPQSPKAEISKDPVLTPELTGHTYLENVCPSKITKKFVVPDHDMCNFSDSPM